MWSRCALRAGDLAGWASRTTGRGAGATLPGTVARRLLPDVLTQLSAGRRTVLVTGTNGKSTTTTLLAEALRAAGDVVTNADGANLLTGLVATLMADRRGSATAVLEVDEVVLPEALAATGAATVVLLNLSRDQLDRVGEVSSHAARWSAAMRRLPYLRIVANADDPLVVTAVRAARPDEVGVVWVAAGGVWRADAALCPRCGFGWDTTLTPWRCSRCELAAPEPEWQLDAGVVLGPSGARFALRLGLPGRAASVDALMALAAAALLGVSVPAALTRMRAVQGRRPLPQHRHDGHRGRPHGPTVVPAP
jgi:UDP-N-acetylmuramyl tripeptide synthase